MVSTVRRISVAKSFHVSVLNNCIRILFEKQNIVSDA